MKNGYVLALVIVVCIAGFIVGPLYAPTPWNYFIALAAMLLIVLAIGQNIADRPLGVLVTERNVMSLTRFQSVFWTLLVVSAFGTIVFARIQAKLSPVDASAVFTPELLALMGISYASAVGAGLATGNKSDKTPSNDEVRRSQNINGDQAATPTSVLYRNKEIKQASLADIFEGDEVADAHLVDLGKVQMFFFTVVAAVIFVTDLITRFGKKDFSIPPIDHNLIALMGISHAAYLGTKAPTKTQEAQPGQQQPAVAPQPAAPDVGNDPVVKNLVSNVSAIQTAVAQLNADKTNWITEDKMVGYVNDRLKQT